MKENKEINQKKKMRENTVNNQKKMMKENTKTTKKEDDELKYNKQSTEEEKRKCS